MPAYATACVPVMRRKSAFIKKAEEKAQESRDSQSQGISNQLDLAKHSSHSQNDPPWCSASRVDNYLYRKPVAIGKPCFQRQEIHNVHLEKPISRLRVRGKPVIAVLLALWVQ
jgi:hypothetical protein